MDPVSSTDPLQVPLLNARGIQVQDSSPRASQLVFTGTVEIQATVWCAAIAISSTLGNRVEVRIYGKIALIDIITTITDSYVYQVLYHLPLN